MRPTTRTSRTTAIPAHATRWTRCCWRVIGQGPAGSNPFHEHANHVRILARATANLMLSPTDATRLGGPDDVHHRHLPRARPSTAFFYWSGQGLELGYLRPMRRRNAAIRGVWPMPTATFTRASRRDDPGVWHGRRRTRLTQRGQRLAELRRMVRRPTTIRWRPTRLERSAPVGPADAARSARCDQRALVQRHAPYLGSGRGEPLARIDSTAAGRRRAAEPAPPNPASPSCWHSH